MYTTREYHHAMITCEQSHISWNMLWRFFLLEKVAWSDMWTCLAAWTSILGNRLQSIFPTASTLALSETAKMVTLCFLTPLPVFIPFDGSPSPPGKPPRPITEQPRHLMQQALPFPAMSLPLPWSTPRFTHQDRCPTGGLLNTWATLGHSGFSHSSGECLHCHLLSGKSPWMLKALPHYSSLKENLYTREPPP